MIESKNSIEKEKNQWQNKALELEERLEKQIAQTALTSTINNKGEQPKDNKTTQTEAQQPSAEVRSKKAGPNKKNKYNKKLKKTTHPKREENTLLIKGNKIFDTIKNKVKTHDLGYIPKQFFETKSGHAFAATNSREELNELKKIIKEKIPEATISPQIKRAPRIEIKSVPPEITEETISDHLCKNNREFEK